MTMNNFAAFILTHGRPNKVKTYKSLRKYGYTGPIYIIIDNEDSTASDYYDNFGEQVIMFDKKAIAKRFDEGDNFDDRRAIFYARNACFDIARELGIEYFIELDDDYYEWWYMLDSERRYKKQVIKNLDAVLEALITFFSNVPATSIAVAQDGDWIGGRHNQMGAIAKRKLMNTFICSTSRPFEFVGRVNEDVNTYVSAGNRGILFLTIMQLSINQTNTQQNTGGMTDIYKQFGTYVKSFYTVMFAPSCVKIGILGDLHDRYHHRIDWDKAVPKIVSERHRKANE